MRSAEEIERAIANLRIPTSPATDQQILADASAALERSYREASEARAPASWRILVKSNWRKYAVAAAILVAAGIGIQQFGGSIDGAKVALADVATALKNVPWMHALNTVRRGEDTFVTEEWFGFDRQVQAGKDPDGTITWSDYDAGQRQCYSPGAEVVRVSSIQATEARLHASSPLALCEKLMELEQARGASFVQETGEYEGTRAVVWRVNRTEEDGHETIEFFVDPSSLLPMAAEVTFVRNDGTVRYEGHVEFNYPDIGPESIYDLGVPQSVLEVIESASEVIPFTSMVEAINRTPWMHVKQTGSIQGEEWYGPNAKVLGLVHSDGRITWMDYVAKRTLLYDPVTRSVTSSELTKDDFDVYACTFVGVLKQAAERAEREGAVVTQERSETGGTSVVVWKVEKPGEMVVSVTVEADTGLPVAAEIRRTGAEKSFTLQADFDYPERGPVGLHDLGVPDDVPMDGE